MSVSKQFVLDANIFIQAHQRYYAFDICPGFWRTLVIQHEKRQVCSIDKVRSELLAGHDDLSEWVKSTTPASFFKGTADIKVATQFANLVNWVQSEAQFNAEAKAEFASAADGWVIAYAKANNSIVVTHEEYAPDSKRRVPMPNVCIEFDVEYCNTFEMLRETKAKFVLRTKKRNA